MDILAHGESQIAFATLVGLTVSIASVVLLIAVLLLRQIAQRRERNHQRAATFWHAALASATEEAPVHVQALPRRDMTGFLESWNRLHELRGDDDVSGMHALASKIDLGSKLQQMVRDGRFHERVMAIIATGYLRNKRSFGQLTSLIDDASPIVSISAARALMRIDPRRAVSQVVPQIVSRHDWVDGGIAQMLNEAGPEAVKEELGAAALRANDEVASRLVRFLAGVSPEAAAPVIARILAEAHDEHLVSTCLQVIDDARDLDKVHALLSHDRWHVRMHAAAAIGRLGVAKDAHALFPLLADPQWWVRYRTAQALKRLLSDGEMEQLRAEQQDRYARDILTHVIAEKAVGETP